MLAAFSGGRPLKTILFDARGKLRNGWWMLLFAGFVFATTFVYRPVSHALEDLGVADSWRGSLPFLLTLLATWICMRLRREPLASVGYALDRRWWRELAIGFGIGLATMAATVLLIWAIGGVRLQPDPARGVGAVADGFVLFVFAALFEENLFRGFLFQRMVAGTNAWIAQLAFALLFALAHGGNPGMQGSTEAWASLDIFLGAIMLGLAYLRTRSLALPIGLHLGWNWLQGPVLGFGVSGTEQHGWFLPVFQGKAQWLTGGAFGPESSVFAVLVDAATIALLWRWKGSVRAAG
jgi:membrane protease YdiL (CAAX protease family)